MTKRSRTVDDPYIAHLVADYSAEIVRQYYGGTFLRTVSVVMMACIDASGITWQRWSCEACARLYFWAGKSIGVQSASARLPES